MGVRSGVGKQPGNGLFLALSLTILTPSLKQKMSFLQLTDVPHSDIWAFFFLLHSPKSRLIQLKKEKLEYTPGEHEHGLFPAPIHVGGYLTCVCAAAKPALPSLKCSGLPLPPLLLLLFRLIPSLNSAFQQTNFAKACTPLSPQTFVSRGFFFP